MASVGIQKTFTSILFFLAIVAPALLVIFVILRFGVDVPFWDDWAFVLLLEQVQKGKLLISQLLIQHNEHRMVFPRLLKLGLIYFSDWNVFYELFASWTCIMLSFLLLWDLLRRTLREDLKRFIKPLVLMNSFLLFSLAQGENFIWGWQLQWFLAEFFVILSIWALARWKGSWTGIVVAALGAFVATYSIASGQFLWLLGLLVLIIERKTWRIDKIISWTIAATFSIGLYLYQFKSQDSKLFTFVEKPLAFAQFVLASLGSPFGAFGPLGSLHTSIIFGAAGLILFCVTLVFLWRHSSDWAIKLLPWTELSLYGLMSVTATAIGRVQYSVAYHALVSRYSIFALLFWIGALVQAVVCAELLSQRRMISVRRACVIFVILFASGYANTAIGRYQRLAEFRHRVHLEQSVLYDYQKATDTELKTVTYMNPNEFRRRAAVLESFRMGPFKKGTGREIADQLHHAWLEEIKSASLQSFNVKANSIYIVRGDVAAKREQETILKFRVRKPGGVHGKIGSDHLPYRNNPTLKSRILVFESRNASYLQVRLMSDSRKRVFRAYYVPLRNGWKMFRVTVPTDVRGYLFALFYSSPPPIPDKMRVSVYDRLQ